MTEIAGRAGGCFKSARTLAEDMAVSRGLIIGPATEARDYAPVLKWLLLNGLAVMAAIVLWQVGLFQAMLNTDRTHISLAILGIFVVTALHCLYQTTVVSREMTATRQAREMIEASALKGFQRVGRTVMTGDGEKLPAGILATHIANLITKAQKQEGERLDQTLLLRALADRLRAREKLGWFVSEGLLRLALLGTAIGFILMLIPISQLSAFDEDTLRKALSGMTGGMAVALNVTVTGIASALALKLEYYLLDGAVAELFDTITEVTEIHVVSALEQRNTDARP